MNSLDQLQPVAGHGPGRRVPADARPRHVPRAARTRRYTGAVLTDHCGLDGEPAPVCQRSFLKRMTARLAERGLDAAGGVRERVLARARGRRRATSRSTPACASRRSPRPPRRTTRRRWSRRSDAQKLRLEQYYAELGHGQQELSTAHAPALQAADEQLLVRETIRGVAAAHGAGRLAGAEAVAGERGQRRPRALLALGGRAQPLLRARRAERARARASSPACSSTCPASAA